MRSALVALGCLSVGLLITTQTSGFTRFVFMLVCINVLLAVSMRMMMLTGEVNLAVAAFFGIGAYGGAVATTMWAWPTAQAVMFGTIAAVVVGLLFGALTLKTTGPYFLLISFAFAEVLRMTYTRSGTLGGNSGIVGIAPSFGWFTSFVLIVSVLLVWASYLFESSRFGLVLKAVEGHNDLAECLGFPTHWVKSGVLGLSCVLSGAAGAMFAHQNVVIAPGDFGFMVSIFAVAWVIIGGMNHILGPVIGATALTVLAQEVRIVGELDHLVYGVAIILAMVFLRGGIWGVLSALVVFIRRQLGRGGPAGTQPTGENGSDVVGSQSETGTMGVER